MTIDQAIKTVEETKPNDISPIIVRSWLSQLDSRIMDELYSKHKTLCDLPFGGYGADTAGNTVLLAPEAYSMIYIYWICYNIDYYYGESEDAMSNKILFNNTWEELANHVCRTYPSNKSSYFVI